MIVSAVIQAGEETAGEVVLAEKQFKTGSRGFWGSAKVVIDGKRYQVQVQAVEIGSKPGSGGEKRGSA
jgi:hypothetical protein